MKQQEYWESVSPTKNFTTPFQAEEFCQYVAKDSLVLDVGCGYGRTLQELHGLGYQNLMGMDFAEGMIRRGQSLYPYLDLRIMEHASIDLPDDSVDAVILFAVITCIWNSEEQRKLIQEIRRVLKSGGILYINDFLLNDDQRNRDRYAKFADKYGIYGVFELAEGAICRHHDVSWIQELLQDYEQLQFQPLTFTTMNGNKSNGFFYIGRK